MKFILTFSIFAILSASTWSTNSLAAASTTYKDNTQRTNLTKTDDFGLGIKWGSLTGLSGKYWVSEMQAWDATIAFQNGNTAIGVDYLWHFRNGVADVTNIQNSSSFIPYIGAGLISAFGSNTQFFNRNTDNFALAARMPLGLEFVPKSIRLGIFAELALGFGFVPTTYTFITADLGARYYF